MQRKIFVWLCRWKSLGVSHSYLFINHCLVVDKCSTGISQPSAHQSLQDIVKTSIPMISTPKHSRVRVRPPACTCTKGCRTSRCRCVINQQVWIWCFKGNFYFFVIVPVICLFVHANHKHINIFSFMHANHKHIIFLTLTAKETSCTTLRGNHRAFHFEQHLMFVLSR